MADYLIADTAQPEQLLNDANLWLDQARLLLQLCPEEPDPAAAWPDRDESLDRLLRMAQGCISLAQRRLLEQQLAAAQG